MLRRDTYIFASMSGMLDLSRDRKVACPQELQRRRKHFLPRLLREARGRLGAYGKIAINGVYLDKIKSTRVE